MPLGIDNSWDHQDFMQQFKIEIKDIKEDFMEFDMIGVDPAIANALRRILIAEVPTVAIEHVFIINNTSIIQVSRSMGALLPAGCWPASQPAQTTRHAHAGHQRLHHAITPNADAPPASFLAAPCQHQP
jgi:hypothetical protein